MTTFIRVTESERINEHPQHQENHAWSPAMHEAYSHGARESFRQHHHGAHHRHDQAAQYLPEMSLIGGQGGPGGASCPAPEQQRQSGPFDANNVAAMDKTLLDLGSFLQKLSAMTNKGDATGAPATDAAPTPGNNVIAQAANQTDAPAVSAPPTDNSNPPTDNSSKQTDNTNAPATTADASTPTPSPTDASAPPTTSSPIASALSQILGNQTGAAATTT